MSQFPTDPEEILRVEPLPEFRRPRERPSRLARAWYGVLWVFGIVVLGYAAVGFFDLGPKPPPKPRPKHELRVIESRPISADETLRIVWMPSEYPPMGRRCLLYNNVSTGATQLSCPEEMFLPDQ